MEKTNIFNRLKAGLTKTRQGVLGSLDAVFSGFSQIDEDFYEELLETLIVADVGVCTAETIITDLRSQVKSQHIKETAECKQLLIDSIKEQMDAVVMPQISNAAPPAASTVMPQISNAAPPVASTVMPQISNAAPPPEKETAPLVILIIGVNGVGKTTTVGKLAALYAGQGKSVVIAAADTFRAAATEQLTVWADRAGAKLIYGQESADPASVIYDALGALKAKGADVLICDTAGRLHNKKNLMEELKKIDRSIAKALPAAARENLLVIDATCGQNALNQAREFGAAAHITGLVVTKLDGSAKGGIVIAIQNELDIPVRYIGVGEQIEDLQAFDAVQFVDALFG